MMFSLGDDSTPHFETQGNEASISPNLTVKSPRERDVLDTGKLNGRSFEKRDVDPHLDLKLGTSFVAFILSFILTCILSKWADSSKIGEGSLIASAGGFLVSTSFFVYYLGQMLKESDETTSPKVEELAL